MQSRFRRLDKCRVSQVSILRPGIARLSAAPLPVPPTHLRAPCLRLLSGVRAGNRKTHSHAPHQPPNLPAFSSERSACR